MWRDSVIRRLTGPERPDVVIISNMIDYSGRLRERGSGAALPPAEAQLRFRQGFQSVLNRLRQADLRIVVIRDTPNARRNFMDCVEENGGAACDRPRSEAVPAVGPDVDVARQVAGVQIVDLTDLICEKTVCPVVRDGQMVYRDSGHLTVGFAATLSHAFDGLFRTSAGANFSAAAQ